MDLASLRAQLAALSEPQQWALAAAAAVLLLLIFVLVVRRMRRRERAASVSEATAPVAEQAVEVQGDDFPGMTPAQARRLGAAGIANAHALWERAQNPAALAALAKTLKLEDFVLRRWVSAADLQRIHGVNGDLAQRLIKTGVRSTAELAAANADRVHNKLQTEHDKDPTQFGLPDRAAVIAMISAAAALKAQQT